MSENNKSPGPISSPRRRAQRLRIAAAVVFLVGIFGADWVYWTGTHSAQSSDDPAMMGNEKARSRQEQILYGKQSVLIDEWSDDLKRPGTQAVIVVVAATLVAVGCFYFARLLEHAPEQTDENG